MYVEKQSHKYTTINRDEIAEEIERKYKDMLKDDGKKRIYFDTKKDSFIKAEAGEIW